MSKDITAIPTGSYMADILLVYTDFAKNVLGSSSYPENHLGLNRLASYLDEKGYKVKIINTTGLEVGTSGPEDLTEYIRKIQNDFGVIGFHVTSWNISHITKILRKLSKRFSDRLVLFGGPLATSEPKRVVEHFRELGLKNIGLVQGYGEFALENILQNPDQIDDLDGVWSWKNSKMTNGSLQRFSNDQMANLPYLNTKYNTFYQNYYKPYIDGELSGLSNDVIFASQGLDVNHGCPFSCSYCSVHVFGNSVTEYSPKRAVDEMEKLAKETGFFMFTYTNSNLMFIRRDWIVEFCEEIVKRNMNEYVIWSAYHHPNTVNLLSVDDLRLMKKAGCDQIVMGIQSVDPYVLKLFNRLDNTYRVLKEIVEKVKAANLELVIDYIRGVPGEDLDIVDEFYDYCTENGIEMREYLLKIYPNTEIVNKNIDFTGYDLVPITGDLAKDLDSYAVVPKMDNPRNRELTQKIRSSNDLIMRSRKIRIANEYPSSLDQAERLMNDKIPNSIFIPNRVKKAMMKMLSGMMNPVVASKTSDNSSVESIMKNLILAGEDSPPMVKNMQEKLKNELGIEKYEMLKKKFLAE